MNWDEFYERFYGISLNTQKTYSYKLTDYGPVDEVFAVVSEFAFTDSKFASRFVSRALDNGVRFTPENILDIAGLIDKSVLSKMAENASPSFTREQLEDVYMQIDDDVFERISKKLHIDIFNDNMTTEGDEQEQEIEFIQPPPRKPGFFTTLLAVLGASDSLGDHRKRHNGRCNGDCANCPPHYGYRYGRWYYGHDHVHGCEFGGNKGSGSRD